MARLNSICLTSPYKANFGIEPDGASVTLNESRKEK